MTIGEGF